MASSSHPHSLQSGEGDVQTPQNPENVGLEMSKMPFEAPEVPQRCMTSEPNSDRPEWLPEGWSVETRTRTTGKTVGVKDRFFYDPIFHRQFRSRKEVEHFLETESEQKYTPPSKTTKLETPKSSGEIFDFNNPPPKVSWVLTNASQGQWTPYIDGEEVPESTRRLWAATMEDIMNGTYKFQE